MLETISVNERKNSYFVTLENLGELKLDNETFFNFCVTLRKICMLSCAAPGVPWQMAQMPKKLCRVEGGMCQGTVAV